MQHVHGFEITSREPLPEIDGEAIEAVHQYSGARLLFLANDDNNKAFGIGFRTPPADDTGVFHILEHSVLCGSARFPVKEPFVDLLKGSMQTFLNAMTFADKTLYPVASTNEQDLFNLMDVYLDAVFHPRIYEKRQIFEQEGWHYELQSATPSGTANEMPGEGNAHDGATANAPSGELSINGVVFNEMKGALSDANSVLYDHLQALLFPDSCYAFESGGTPAAIPALTYEGYLDEHRRHYRTDNSFIILYGNLDFDRALAFLDERYLSPVADEQREHDAQRQADGLSALAPRTIDIGGPASGEERVPMATAEENACLGVGYVIGDSGERMRIVATEILLDALFGSNEAPMKRRLLDLGIAHDIHAFVSDALAQPFAVVQMQRPEPAGDNAQFADTDIAGSASGQDASAGAAGTAGTAPVTSALSHAAVIAREMASLLEDGLDRTLVEAALSHEEFQMREHDFGMADGVVYAMTSLSGWLYDDEAATTYLRYEDVFADLREKLGEGYFEDLARSLLIDNAHVAQVEIVPDANASDGGLSERIAAAEAKLTDAERERILAEVKLLRDLQEAPDSPEAVATLPRLGIADIGDAPDEPAYALDSAAPLACIRHEVPTRGISYAYRYFDLGGIAFEDLPYVSVLASVLGKLDTALHSASEIDTLVQARLGNLTFFTDVYEDADNIARAMPHLVVSASALSENATWLSTLPREIMLETDFASQTSRSKILDILKQRKIGMEHAFMNSGHSCAMARCKSYYSHAGVVREQLGNVGYYRFLCELIEHYDERAEALAVKLSKVSARVFTDDGCTLSFSGDDAAYGRFWDAGPSCGTCGTGPGAPEGQDRHVLRIPDPVVAREAFIVPSDVCYAALAWDRRLIGTPYTGIWAVAARALSYDYLWNEVRVKGGAYGAGFQSTRVGTMRFYSYRDPRLDETLARFAQAPSWLKSFDPSREDLEGFVVATTAGFDAPVKPRELIRRQMSDYLTGRDPADRKKVRSQAIEADAASVRALSDVVAAAADQGVSCVFGNRAILESSSHDFDLVNLIGVDVE